MKWLLNHGLISIFLLSFAGSSLVPLPMVPVEALIAAGVLMGYNKMLLFALVVVSSTMGGYTTYLLGLRGHHVCEKLLGDEAKKRMRKYRIKLENWGAFFVFIASTAFVIPYDLVALQSGLLRLNKLKVFTATFLGKIIRTGLVLLLVARVA